MTTIKSILNWLFGIYKSSPLLKGALWVFIGCHLFWAVVLYFAWLIKFITRITA